MSPSDWRPEYTEQAQEFWRQYQQSHDVSSLHGKVAGIDPVSGQVWIGGSGVEVIDQMEAEGVHTLLYFVTVGLDYFVRKGRR